MRVRKRLFEIFLSPRYPLGLLVLFGIWFGVWAIDPPHPADFAVEHILTVLSVGLLVAIRRRFPLSHLSYTLIFLFLCLHVVGAHYTYSEVPYDSWAGSVSGMFGVRDFSLSGAFGFKRNQYDRVVHFAFGLLLAYPVRELVVRVAKVRGFWGYYLPLDVVMASSMVYELIEWIGSGIGADFAQNYVGTQGDVWDAQKDMALAAFGGLLAMTITALVNRRFQKDFAREFAESLKPTEDGPLGEQKLLEELEELDRDGESDEGAGSTPRGRGHPREDARADR